MIVVNLFGVPGSGKSTAAAYIFYRLKTLGINCELVTEVAKDLVWDGNKVGIETQMYVSGTQLYRLSRLEGKVDVAITDAPLLLQAVYYYINKCPNPESFQDVEYESFIKYNNLNYMLPLPDHVDPTGRVEYSDSNMTIQKMILALLSKYDVEFKDIGRASYALDRVVDDVLDLLTWER